MSVYRPSFHRGALPAAWAYAGWQIESAGVQGPVRKACERLMGLAGAVSIDRFAREVFDDLVWSSDALLGAVCAAVLAREGRRVALYLEHAEASGEGEWVASAYRGRCASAEAVAFAGEQLQLGKPVSQTHELTGALREEDRPSWERIVDVSAVALAAPRPREGCGERGQVFWGSRPAGNTPQVFGFQRMTLPSDDPRVGERRVRLEVGHVVACTPPGAAFPRCLAVGCTRVGSALTPSARHRRLHLRHRLHDIVGAANVDRLRDSERLLRRYRKAWGDL